MRRWLIALAALALLAVGAGIWLFSGSAGVGTGLQALRDAAPGLEIDAEVDTDLSLKGVELVQGKEGHPLWRLTARSAKYEGNRSMVRVEGVKITYFSSNNGQLVVESPFGDIRQERGDARLWPEVKARFGENTLTARQLEYDGQDGVVLLTGDVLLEGPNMRCNAPRVFFYPASNKVVADNGVTTVISMALDDARSAASSQKGEKE